MIDKKHIVAAGCSFTDNNYKSGFHRELEISWPKWPEILGNYLGLPAKNFGSSGGSNDYIYNTISNHIFKNHKDIELVAIGWTDFERFAIHNHINLIPRSLILGKSGIEQGFAYSQKYSQFGEELYKDVFGKKWNAINFLRARIESNLGYMFRIQELCKLYDIPLVMSCLVGNFDLPELWILENELNMFAPISKIDYYELYSKSEFLPLIDPKYNIGYPFLQALGGFVIENDLDDSLRISDADLHPNAEGQKAIAKMYYEHYKKHYL